MQTGLELELAWQVPCNSACILACSRHFFTGFSFKDTRIIAIGTTQSYCWESPKPLEFGNAGQNRENIGWRVKVKFTELSNTIRPKDHMAVLGPVLPDRYSPLQPSGNGLQSVYLTELPIPFAEVLMGLIGSEAAIVRARVGQGLFKERSPLWRTARPCNAWARIRSGWSMWADFLRDSGIFWISIATPCFWSRCESDAGD